MATKSTTVFVPTYRKPTRPVYRLHKVYTLADGSRVWVQTREWTWQFGYLYYVDNLTPGGVLGRRPKRVITEKEFSAYMTTYAEVKAA